jgi:hypothetical protein
MYSKQWDRPRLVAEEVRHEAEEEGGGRREEAEAEVRG